MNGREWADMQSREDTYPGKIVTDYTTAQD